MSNGGLWSLLARRAGGDSVDAAGGEQSAEASRDLPEVSSASQYACRYPLWSPVLPALSASHALPLLLRFSGQKFSPLLLPLRNIRSVTVTTDQDAI